MSHAQWIAADGIHHLEDGRHTVEKDDRISQLERALTEIERLRLATDEGSLRVRADRMWEIAREALYHEPDCDCDPPSGAGPCIRHGGLAVASYTEHATVEEALEHIAPKRK